MFDWSIEVHCHRFLCCRLPYTVLRTVVYSCKLPATQPYPPVLHRPVCRIDLCQATNRRLALTNNIVPRIGTTRRPDLLRRTYACANIATRTGPTRGKSEESAALQYDPAFRASKLNFCPTFYERNSHQEQQHVSTF